MSAMKSTDTLHSLDSLDSLDSLNRLAQTIESRKAVNGGDPNASYVARLLAKGPDAFLKKIGEKYVPYWPIFVILASIGIAVGYLNLRYSTPIYVVKARLYIKDDKAGSDQSKLFEALNVLGEKKNVNNEIEVFIYRFFFFTLTFMRIT